MAYENWSNFKPNSNTERLAYVHKDTEALAKENPTVDTIVKALYKEAVSLMGELKEAGLTTTTQREDSTSGEMKSRVDAAMIKVEPATKWNKETKESEPITREDGSPVYGAKIVFNHNGNSLNLFAKEDVSEGVKFTNMNGSKWNAQKKLEFIKREDIQGSNLYVGLQKIANFIEDKNIIADKTSRSQLQEFSVTANKYFSNNSNKVEVDGESKNDAYAQHKNNEFGEKVIIKSHTEPEVVVELGVNNKDGEKYAMVTNFALNENGESIAKDENGKITEPPLKYYLNKPEDVKQLIKLPEIQDIIYEFKGFSEKEQDKALPKDKQAKDKSGSRADEYPF